MKTFRKRALFARKLMVISITMTMLFTYLPQSFFEAFAADRIGDINGIEVSTIEELQEKLDDQEGKSAVFNMHGHVFNRNEN